MTDSPPPFAAQRVLFLMLLLGMTAYSIGAAVVLQTNDGRGLADQPIPELDSVVIAVGIGTAVAAVAVRALLRRRAAGQPSPERGRTRFLAVLIPLATLEGGCLLGVTAWLLNGNAVPGLAVALVLLAIAIAIVPFRDPDADA
ncbi:MAG: hypothetical protein KDE27_22140 [Planctomycetes bacterium]|nr:hypothetical protein [Planctomycetota bacterium]